MKQMWDNQQKLRGSLPFINKLILALILITAPALGYAKEEDAVRLKFGLTRNTSEVDYTYTTQRLKSGETVANEPVEANHLVSLSGNDLYLEMVVSGKFGLELNFGLSSSAAENTFEIEADGDTIKIGDVRQSLTNTFSYGVNVYFFNHFKSGLNAALGVVSGNYQLVTEFTNGGASRLFDDRDTTVAGFPETQTSTIDIPVTAVKLGFDIVLKTAGVRFVYFLPLGIGEIKNNDLGNTDLGQPQQESVSIVSSYGISGYYYW